MSLLAGQIELISYLGEMQRFHLGSSAEFDRDRLYGLQLYFVAVAALTAYAAGRGNRAQLIVPYRVLVVGATILVLLFQMYWNYYARQHRLWANEYFNEIVEVEQNAIQSELLAVLGPKMVDCEGSEYVELSWRAFKSKEVRANWLQTKVDFCGILESNWDPSLSKRQFSMWLFAILIFSAISLIFSIRLFQEPLKENEKDV